MQDIDTRPFKFPSLLLQAREGIRSVKWQEVSSHINLQVNYHLILKKVAELRKAYFWCRPLDTGN